MSGTDKHPGTGQPEEPVHGTPGEELRRAVHAGDIPGARVALQRGADVNELDAVTGLAALHLVTGLNDAAFARFLIEEARAAFFPDRFGRWPSLVAAENRVDDELSLYIAEKEAEYMARHGGSGAGP